MAKVFDTDTKVALIWGTVVLTIVALLSAGIVMWTDKAEKQGIRHHEEIQQCLVDLKNTTDPVNVLLCKSAVYGPSGHHS